MNTYICDRWHLNIVSRDSFLDLVYWKDNEHKRPHDYYTRDYTIELDGGEDLKIYRYTSEDGYLAAFMRTFFIRLLYTGTNAPFSTGYTDIVPTGTI